MSLAPTGRAYLRALAEMDDRDDQDGDDVGHLDHRVDRRPGGVLVGFANGVAGDRGGVGLGALAPVGTVLDQFLGVVPGTAAGGHRDGHEQADDDHADQQATQRLVAEQTYHQGDDDRDQRGEDHFALSGGGDDPHRISVFRPLGPLHDPRVLTELAPHLLDHLAPGPAHSLDRQRGEQVDHHAADDQPDQDLGLVEVEADRVI